MKRKQASSPPATAAVAQSLRCEWQAELVFPPGGGARSGGGRCFLTGAGKRGGRLLCDWHLFCLTRLVPAEDWHAFERFQATAGAYCCELAHWPIDLLWKAAKGLQDLRTADRRPCRLPWCRHAPDVGPMLVHAAKLAAGEDRGR